MGLIVITKVPDTVAEMIRAAADEAASAAEEAEAEEAAGAADEAGVTKAEEDEGIQTFIRSLIHQTEEQSLNLMPSLY